MLTIADGFDRLLSMPLGMFLIFGIVGIVAIVFGSITKIFEYRTRERTRREIAAYVAEGTIDPDKAIAMLGAGGSGGDKDDDKA